MKKYYLIFVLLIASSISGQSVRFSVISSPEIGDKDNETKLKSAIQIINSQKNLDLSVFAGNISYSGKNSELADASSMLDQIEGKQFAIPGASDSRFSESGLSKFSELFGDDKFNFEIDSSLFIGIGSAVDRENFGHIKPEDLSWLKEFLSDRDSTTAVFLFLYHNPAEEIDNINKLINIVERFKKTAIFYGNSEEFSYGNILGIPLFGIQTITETKNNSITIIDNRNDSLFVFESVKNQLKPLKSISLIRGKSKAVMPTKLIPEGKNILWNYDLNYTLEADLLTAGDYIYACDRSGLITCLDTAGNVVWEYDSFGTIINKPIVADGIFAVSTLQGDLLTLDAVTGESIQTIGFDDEITSPLTVFNYKGNTNFIIPKQSDSKAAVVLGTASGKLYCYDLETLQQIWVYEKIKGMIAAEPLYTQNKFIFPAFDDILYCIDAQQGWLIWKWNGVRSKNEFPYYCSPVANSYNVYLSSPDGNVYAVDILLGKTDWINDKLKAYESIGISDIGHRLFIKSRDDKFHIISAKTSYWVKEVNMKYGADFTNSRPIEYNGQVILGTQSGSIYKVNEKFKYEKLFSMGNAPVKTIKHFKENLFAASNLDGRIVLFKINE